LLLPAHPPPPPPTPRADTSNRRLLRRALTRRLPDGIAYHECGNGAEAVAAIRAYAAARGDGAPLGGEVVVCMDKEMPVMDGAAATRLLRADGHRCAIVAITGHVDERETRLLMEAGADAVCTKPVRVPELVEVVEEVRRHVHAHAHAQPHGAGDDADGSGAAVAAWEGGGAGGDTGR
jgi:CheY-like chemotaxis protein